MTEKLFVSMTPGCLAEMFAHAKQFICYAAPGIESKSVDSLVKISETIKPDNIAVHLDFHPHVFRMGFGDWKAINLLQEAKIKIYEVSGLRASFAIVDSKGYIFTPTALFVDNEVQSNSAPNAMRLTEIQIASVLARFSKRTNSIAQRFFQSSGANKISDESIEVQCNLVENSTYTAVKEQLDAAPPVQFELARKVHVYSGYLQYVELKLEGTAIQRHKVRIPPTLSKIGSDVLTNEELARRLRTTFDLIEKDSNSPFLQIAKDVHQIRNNFTPSLGVEKDRVILKSKKAIFEERINTVRENLKKHQENMESKLTDEFNKSCKLIVDAYFPLVQKNPPDSLRGKSASGAEPTDDEIRKWIDRELRKEFPTVRKFLAKMKLDVKYKDVTIETMKRQGFFDDVKKAYPDMNWDKLYDSHIAPAVKLP